MSFKRINLDDWYRKEYFEHYLNQQTTFSMTSEIDISILYNNIKKNDFKFYPTFIYMVTNVVNSNTAFRKSFDNEAYVGYWEKLHPSYTIFDDSSETFSSIWTEITDSFKQFHKEYEEDVNTYKGVGGLFPKSPVPNNTVPISMIPWSSFTAFNLNINNGSNFLFPIITAGKFIKKDDGIFLPVALQVHHAVCDGYHAGLFMNSLQSLSDHSHEWLSK